MGAKARKENNDRSRKVFQSATDQYESSKAPSKVEDDLKTAYQGYQNPTALEETYKNRAANPFDAGEEDTFRSRALSPIQAAYSHSADEMKRQAVLHGGAPNLIASLAKNQRNLSQSANDATINANASLMSEKDRRINEALSGQSHETDARNQHSLDVLGQMTQAEAARRGAGLQTLGIQAGVQPIQGFGWGKLAGVLGNVASGALTSFTGGASRKPSGDFSYGNPSLSF